MSSKVLTKEQFEALDPKSRGHAVYWYGSREDQPNVPEESNPYPAGSLDAVQWDKGNFLACLDAQDYSEE